MKKLIIVYVVLIVAVILLALVRGGTDLLNFIPFFGQKTATARIGETTINLELADSDQERQKGLSGRDSLAEDRGMLFVFDNKDKYGFWMKEMKFPIDIIYLDDETVVYVVENAPSSVQAPNLTIYTPDEPANRVLEINAGQSKKLNIKKGTKIDINL